MLEGVLVDPALVERGMTPGQVFLDPLQVGKETNSTLKADEAACMGIVCQADMGQVVVSVVDEL